MPYKRVSRSVYTKASGKWKVKQVCQSIKNAKAAMRLLRGIEAGTIKKRK